MSEARSTRVLFWGEDHELVADTDQWLGNVMREDGNLSEALEYFKIALRVKKLRLGENHEDVANAMHNMAIVLNDIKKFNLALGFYKEVRTSEVGLMKFESASHRFFERYKGFANKRITLWF